jgi:hypothetical protein
MGIPVVLIIGSLQPYRYSGYLDFGWNLDNAPWEQPVPKVSKEFIHGLSYSFRQVIQKFIGR